MKLVEKYIFESFKRSGWNASWIRKTWCLTVNIRAWKILQEVKAVKGFPFSLQIAHQIYQRFETGPASKAPSGASLESWAVLRIAPKRYQMQIFLTSSYLFHAIVNLIFKDFQNVQNSKKHLKKPEIWSFRSFTSCVASLIGKCLN